MARDRQRAKQRKSRRGASNPGPALSKPRRTDVPGELEHASGEVDEFEAAMLAGAEAADAQAAVAAETRVEPEPEAELEPSADGHDDLLEEDLDEPLGGAAVERRRTGVPTAGRGPGRWMAFLRASWAELQRVQWPDRRQVAQATGVVIGFVIVAGVYLGIADWAAQKIVNAIL